MSPGGVITVLIVALVSVLYAALLNGLGGLRLFQGAPYTIVQVVIGVAISVGIPSLAIVAANVATTATGAVALIAASICTCGTIIAGWYVIAYQIQQRHEQREAERLQIEAQRR